MTTFNDLGLSNFIVEAVTKLGFISPTPVQEKAIPMLLQDNSDLVALAQTGTGKTAAFGLPILDRIDQQDSSTQAIVLCPTRELCLQLTRDLKSFSQTMSDLKILAVYGGAPIDKQIRALKKGVQIIIATPGRMNDMIRRKMVNFSQVQHVVLDEADEMLSMGFLEDLENILKIVPQNAQTLLFSATMPKQVAGIAKKYMTNPKEITIGAKNSGSNNIEHECYTVHAKNRYEALKRIADIYPEMYGIVFCRTRAETQEVAAKLIKDGYNADALHGDISQSQRDVVMKSFRDKDLQMLVATDVAARGLDVNELSHVINYNLPDSPEIYTHRSGRTGRAGKKGVSVVIVHMREKHKLARIERIMKNKFIMKKVPAGADICVAQLMALINRVKNVEIDHEHIDQYLPAIFETLEGMNKKELIKHFVSLEFNRFLSYYKNAVDLNCDVRERSKQRLESDFTRLFINLGKVDHLRPEKLISLVNKATPTMSINIGRIDIMEKYSFFDVETKDIQILMGALNKMEHEKRQICVEITKNSKQSAKPREGGRNSGKRGSRFSKSRHNKAKGQRRGK